MSLEELLRDNGIRKIKPDRNVALKSLEHAKEDIETAKILIENEKYDWALAIAYNAMLQAGRALMFSRGCRPSSREGHLAVIKFLHVVLGEGAGEKLVIALNGTGKKRHRVVYEDMDVVSESEALRMGRKGG
jgi:uncharacterized protein (UPF0332 family)